ncbi:sigma factor-like helix-turn-helix DNA-binding protein [Porphyrobacter sp. CACIAM 03H1]|uniref:sigma factor-like helix-turn-helix DNA-binding protein n=1 Tax=Porphyrobacter sp. CACIAM 03H1 TaxID=2003315 RepID=UPI0012FE63EB|nr:sigma factor-like helix-turn-helix DNA-binding protein [Porphyrobacter sp. CACIAM 03H1]
MQGVKFTMPSMAQSELPPGSGRHAALERLTDREKECLLRRLHHQTAKEMAIDMGLSSHAIEKRLKMARTKLGVSSSLQAARLLAASEGYQITGPLPTDLDEAQTSAKAPHLQTVLTGACLMFAAVIVVMLVAGPGAEPFALPRPGEIIVSGPSTFDELDKDRSGFLEGEEAPALAQFGGDAEYEQLPDGSVHLSGDYVTVIESSGLRDRFYLEADADRDGKVSAAEFSRWAGIRTTVQEPAGCAERTESCPAGQSRG